MSFVPKSSGRILASARRGQQPDSEGVGKSREPIVRILRELGYEYRDEPFRLSSGEMSHDYVDGKRAVASGEHLRFVAQVIIDVARSRNARFDAVGGLTMGADPLSHAVAILSGTRWFSVRKEPKQHGKQRLIEGAELSEGTTVLLVDDVVTTGGSILKAVEAIQETGARVTLIMSLLDRGDLAGKRLAERGIPYQSLATYRDLDISPVSG